MERLQYWRSGQNYCEKKCMTRVRKGIFVSMGDEREEGLRGFYNKKFNALLCWFLIACG